MKKCAFMACLLAFAVDAGTIYVDAVNGVDDAAHTGASEQLAKKTLQAAVDAAQTDDTVIALPGYYDEGFAVDGTYTNRVLITKRITLKSKEKWGAHIVGAFDSASRASPSATARATRTSTASTAPAAA